MRAKTENPLTLTDMLRDSQTLVEMREEATCTSLPLLESICFSDHQAQEELLQNPLRILDESLTEKVSDSTRAVIDRTYSGEQNQYQETVLELSYLRSQSLLELEDRHWKEYQQQRQPLLHLPQSPPPKKSWEN